MALEHAEVVVVEVIEVKVQGRKEDEVLHGNRPAAAAGAARGGPADGVSQVGEQGGQQEAALPDAALFVVRQDADQLGLGDSGSVICRWRRAPHVHAVLVRALPPARPPAAARQLLSLLEQGKRADGADQRRVRP